MLYYCLINKYIISLITLFLFLLISEKIVSCVSALEQLESGFLFEFDISEGILKIIFVLVFQNHLIDLVSHNRSNIIR